MLPNQGMYPDWPSDWWLLGSQDDTQPTDPHQPGANSTYEWHNLSSPLMQYLIHSYLMNTYCVLDTEAIAVVKIDMFPSLRELKIKGVREKIKIWTNNF